MEIILNEFPAKVTEKDFVAIDTELYGMNKYRLHWATEGTFASLQFTLDGETVYVITEESLVKPAMDILMPANHIFHNAYFDIRHLRRWCEYPDKENVYDTMLTEKLLYANYYDTFGLADLMRRYFGVIISKREREEFAVKTKLTKEMLDYSAKDAVYTFNIFKEQSKKFKERKDVLKIWKKVDLPALYAILDFKPVKVWVEEWIRIAKISEEISLGIKKEVEEIYGISVSSVPQVLAKLRKMGYKIDGTGDKILRNLLKTHGEIDLVSKILEFRKHAKRSSSYGKNWVERYFSEDNFTRPGFSVSEAITGRLASKNFNIQNIPAGKEYRSCFLASDENHKIIVCDYSAQEPRITAFESQDKKLIKMTHIVSESIHVNVGRELFKDPTLTKKDKRYKGAKGCNLGIQYGLTAVGLRRDLNDNKDPEDPEVTLNDAQELLDQYFTTFPGVKDWADRQKKCVYNPGYVQTHLGRRTWLNPYNWRSKNNALNSPIQGGAADITKISLAKIREISYKRYGTWYAFATVHDEHDFDAPIKFASSDGKVVIEDFIPEYSRMIEYVMNGVAEKVYPGIKFTVETVVGDNWAAK